MAITKDETEYVQREGESVNNLYEKLTVKVPKELKIPAGTKVSIKGGKATVYGEYRNQLSITAVTVVPVAEKRNA